MSEDELNETVGRLRKYIELYKVQGRSWDKVKLTEAIKTELKAAYNKGQDDILSFTVSIVKE